MSGFRLTPADARCIALDMNGLPCRNKPVRVTGYHGDCEIYGTFHEPWPCWVRASLCERHSRPEVSK